MSRRSQQSKRFGNSRQGSTHKATKAFWRLAKKILKKK